MLTYHRVTSIEDRYFKPLHELLGTIFPPEEVLAYELWREPLEDPSIHVYGALLGDEVVGATEYRYDPKLRVAMTDFTIIGKPALGVGRFLMRNRQKDLERLAEESGTEPIGMFAEIYDPYRAASHEFGGVTPMNPFVRREVLSHIGYKRLDLQYVHPSWDHEGAAVTELDLGFLPQDEDMAEIDASLVAQFLTGYYAALPNKPAEWSQMVDKLSRMDKVALLPL
ncbi:GNAT family N-acetyltransferase [Paenibacillus sp. PL2-23]|uniref:GNAT family N-acetyltransferase n=1 Tax=Paenibacillus sp. PL2-23 TaxID=2100729 RepID=UPI0030F6752C